MSPILICFFSCILASLITCLIVRSRSETGVLRIDHSNPEKDLYKIEIDNLDKLAKKKYLILTIDNHADLSQ